MCDPLTTPTNGLITYSPDTTPPFDFETMASYSCNVGFGLRNGGTVRSCVNSAVISGQWSGTNTDPECDSKWLLNENVLNTSNYTII